MKLSFYSYMMFLCLTVANNQAKAQSDSNSGQTKSAENGGGTEQYPYWGAYQKTPIADIKAAEWINKDNTIDGWDWSLPAFVKPAAKSNLCIARNSGLGTEKIEKLPKVNFPCNPVIAHWVNWRLLEPEEGKFDFQPLIDNIKLAGKKGYGSIVRIHFSGIGFAPEWIKKYNIPIRKDSKANPKVTNYEVSHPEFHKRYLKFIDALGKSGIPKIEEVKGLFLGYASSSYGDEGIGPYPEHMAGANDTVKHVVERIDAWANACKGVEEKVIMGGLSNYGNSKGFGVRRGFVEMYLYHIPDEHIGQILDSNGYLIVDESNQIVAKNVFNGDENEEYNEACATEVHDFRFGKTTESFPYRYFTANLRLLQMRCNDLLNNDFALLPEMLAWVGIGMGKTMADAPDAWTFLRESYLRQDGGRPVKNFERWLYQRDMPGYETTPAMKIEQAIKMWMVQQGKYYDFVAREGKKIGFDIEEKCPKLANEVAIKVSYFDTNSGEMNLVYNNGMEQVKKITKLNGDGKLKTATFFVGRLKAKSQPHNYDFTLEAGNQTEKITVSIVRVIGL